MVADFIPLNPLSSLLLPVISNIRKLYVEFIPTMEIMVMYLYLLFVVALVNGMNVKLCHRAYHDVMGWWGFVVLYSIILLGGMPGRRHVQMRVVLQLKFS